LIINSEEIGILNSLGLSITQAKAYLALIRLGRAKAGEIHKKANVARQDVYRVLEKLREMGLVEKIVCSPIEYVPTPFKDGLNILVEKKRTEFRETEKMAEKIKDIVSHNNISIEEAGLEGISATLEEKVIVSKIRNKFNRAMLSVEFVCKWEPFVSGTLSTYDTHKRALKRGVKARTVVELPKNSVIMPKPIQKLIQENFLEVRTLDSILFISLGIIDKKEVIFTPLPQRTTETPTYWSKNIGFVEIVNNYFETMWNKADPLDMKVNP
jgi:sugar-specific transcriptional regulator TrmB